MGRPERRDKKRETAWLGSKTEVYGSALASGAGRGGNDEPKGGGNGAGPGPEASVMEGGARTSWGSGRTNRPPRPDQGEAGAAPPSAEAGTGRPPLPAAPGALWPRRAPSRGLPADPGERGTHGHGSRRPGGREPRGGRGRFPVPSAGAWRVQGRA